MTDLNTKDMQEALHLLETATHLIKCAMSKRGEEARMDARCASWRLADAAGLYRRAMDATHITGCGLTEHTGRGYILPQRMEGV